MSEALGETWTPLIRLGWFASTTATLPFHCSIYCTQGALESKVAMETLHCHILSTSSAFTFSFWIQYFSLFSLSAHLFYFWEHSPSHNVLLCSLVTFLKCSLVQHYRLACPGTSLHATKIVCCLYSYAIKGSAYGPLQNEGLECSTFSSGKDVPCSVIDSCLKRNHSDMLQLEYPNRRLSSSSWGPGATLICKLCQRFWRQEACQKEERRKWGKIKLSKGMVLTEGRSAVIKLLWIFSFLFAGIHELSSPGRNPKAKQWALIPPALSGCEQPTRAQGREREMWFTCFLASFIEFGSQWVSLLHL